MVGQRVIHTGQCPSRGDLVPGVLHDDQSDVGIASVQDEMSQVSVVHLQDILTIDGVQEVSDLNQRQNTVSIRRITFYHVVKRFTLATVTCRTLSTQQPIYLVNLLHFTDIFRTHRSPVSKQLFVPKTVFLLNDIH